MAAKEPHNHDMEKSLVDAVVLAAGLGDGLLVYRQVEHQCGGLFHADDFHNYYHRLVWSAIEHCAAKRLEPDALMVQSILEERGQFGGDHKQVNMAYLAALGLSEGHSANATHYAKRIMELSGRRLLMDAAQKIYQEATKETETLTEVIDYANRKIEQARKEPIPTASAASVSDMLMKRYKDAMTKQDSGKGVQIPTGFDGFDWVTDGQIMLGRLMYVLGASEMGKSTLIAQMVIEFSKHHWVLIVSQEMPDTEYQQRIACQMAGIPSRAAQDGILPTHDLEKYFNALGTLSERRIEYMNGMQSIGTIRARTMELVDRYGGPGIVVVDTVNKVKESKSLQSRQGLEMVSAGLDALKGDSGCLVIGAIQQYVETNTTDPAKLRPTSNNIKEAKALKEDADLLIGVYRADVWRRQYPNAFRDDDCPEGAALIMAVKNRYGDPRRTKRLKWNATVPKFDNYNSLQLVKEAA